MKIFYAKKNGSYNPKNKLHEAVQKHVEQFNGILVDANKLEAFKSDLKDKVEELNKQFPRCRPIELHINSYSPLMIQEIYITASEVFSIYLREIHRRSIYSTID